MINMFLFCFALFVLINLGVHGQVNNPNTIPRNNVGSAEFFGQLHHLIDQQGSISCYRIRANIKNAHPLDNTKYFICRNEQNYEVFTCPNGGIFDEREKACIDLCEQRKPCLNGGQCIILANLTLQCVCRRDWTGDRCEIPLSTCADNPCGPNAECRMLHSSDYSQDYVCICDNQRTYGRNCQQTVPNPCLSNSRQQFHPFAFGRRAYINCDDERIFFQPCNANLYWNQEEKRCDRVLPLLLRAPFLNIKNRNQWQREEQDFPNRFVETTTAANRVFHLEGFSADNVPSDTQQRNNQFGFVQARPWQNNQVFQNQEDQFRDTTNEFNRPNLPMEPQLDQQTTTIATNELSNGRSVQFLRGWKSEQQGNLNSVPTNQFRS